MSEDKAPPSGLVAVSPLIAFLIPGLPFLIGLLNRFVPSIRSHLRVFKVKRIYFPEFMIDISYGAAFLAVVHLVLMILVGSTVVRSELSFGKTYWESVETASGQVALMNYWLVLLPSAKSRLVPIEGSEWAGAPFERAIQYHQVLGFLAIITSLIHLSIAVPRHQDIILSTSYGNLEVVPAFGYTAFILACAMAWTSFEPFRRAQYEIFQRVHHLYVLVVIFIVLHSPSSIVGFIPGIILHGLDHFDKIVGFINTRKLIIVSCTDGRKRIVTIRVPINVIGTPAPGLGSYYFVNIPMVSRFEWHPFSVSDYDELSNTITFHIQSQQRNSFTRRFFDYAKARIRYEDIESAKQSQASGSLLNRDNSDIPRIKVYGPFGNLSIDLELYNHIILVAGGIGVTPMWMILKDIIKYCNRTEMNPRASLPTQSPDSPKRKIKPPSVYPILRKVSLIWAYDGEELRDLFKQNLPTQQTFPVSESSSDLSLMQDIVIEYRCFNTSKTEALVSSEVSLLLNYISKTKFTYVNCLASITNQRPDILGIISEYKSQSHGNACIVACGPYSLTSETVTAASGANYDVHVEHFEF